MYNHHHVAEQALGQGLKACWKSLSFQPQECERESGYSALPSDLWCTLQIIPSQSWASRNTAKGEDGISFSVRLLRSLLTFQARDHLLCEVFFDWPILNPVSLGLVIILPSSSSTVIASRDNCITEAEPVSLPLDLLCRCYFLLEFPFF